MQYPWDVNFQIYLDLSDRLGMKSKIYGTTTTSNLVVVIRPTSDYNMALFNDRNSSGILCMNEIILKTGGSQTKREKITSKR